MFGKSKNDKQRQKFAIEATKVEGPRGAGKGLFEVKNVEVIFDGGPGGYSLAFGNFISHTHTDPNKRYLLIRWNGSECEEDEGFPISGPYASWFPMPDLMVEVVLRVTATAKMSPDALAAAYGFDTSRSTDAGR